MFRIVLQILHLLLVIIVLHKNSFGTEDAPRETTSRSVTEASMRELPRADYGDPNKSNLPLAQLIPTSVDRLHLQKVSNLQLCRHLPDMIACETAHPSFVSLVRGNSQTEAFLLIFRKHVTQKMGLPYPDWPLYSSNPLTQFSSIQALRDTVEGKAALELEFKNSGIVGTVSQFLATNNFLENYFVKEVVIVSCNFSIFHNYQCSDERSLDYCKRHPKIPMFEKAVREFLQSRYEPSACKDRLEQYVKLLRQYATGFETGDLYHILIRITKFNDLVRICSGHASNPQVSLPQDVNEGNIHNYLAELQRKNLQARLYLSGPAFRNGDLNVRIYKTIKDPNIISSSITDLHNLVDEDYSRPMIKTHAQAS